jgi:hypothetical protein
MALLKILTKGFPLMAACNGNLVWPGNFYTDDKQIAT